MFKILREAIVTLRIQALPAIVMQMRPFYVGHCVPDLKEAHMGFKEIILARKTPEGTVSRHSTWSHAEKTKFLDILDFAPQSM